jgi:E3 ubiquitin-protein ligase RHA2
MEVASVLVSVLFAAFSLPCLLLLVVVAEAALRLAALAVRGDGYAWPSRSAFLGYRIARGAGHFSSYSSSSSSSSVSGGGGGFFQQDEPLPPELLDLLAVAVYRKGTTDAAVVDCVFCLSRVDEGEEVRELRCRHVFHRECLDAWLLRPRATCPLCRDRLLPSDPPRACASAFFDDDEIYVDEHDDDLSSSSPTYAAGASYPHGAALWHM